MAVHSFLGGARIGFLALKLLNLALVTLYSFEIIFVLVRTVPADFYPWLVFLASIGGYVLATDMGFSAYVYAEVRRDFLNGAMAGADDLVSQAITLYLAIALAAAALAGLIIPVVSPAGWAMALICYFATIVLPLPWMLVRRVAAALDLYVAMEAIECVRRALSCVLAAGMLFGLGLLGFALASIALWLVAAAASWLLLRRHGFRLELGSPARIAGFWRAHRGGVIKSGRFAALEFVVYNFPYLAIPVMFHGPGDLVAFDLFNKVARFGGAAYAVPGELFCPPQTRAYYDGDAAGVIRYQRLSWMIGAVPLIVGGVLIGAVGGPVFDLLLAGNYPIGPLVRVAMIVMLAALLLQSASCGFLLSVGRYDPLSSVAAITVGLMLAAMIVTMLSGIPFGWFMLLYVGVYVFHAGALQWLFRRLGTPPRAGAAPVVMA